MSSQVLIELENVTIGHDRIGMLGAVNLSIERGQCWGMIGPNGGGKTTLLKTILGLIPMISGNITRADDLVFGYVPQRESFDPIFPISAAEVVAMGRYSRIPVGSRVKKEDRVIVMECLEQVEIAHLRNRPFRSLSGGEKQRTLLARAIAGTPDLLALDEPTASVDMKGEAAIMELVTKIKEENNLTVVIVSHLLSKISGFADRVIVIDKDSKTFCAGIISEILTSDMLSKIFDLDITVGRAAGKMPIFAR